MTIDLPIVPPTTTAQMKRVRVIRGRPMFFKNKASVQAEGDYLTLLQPHQPPAPMPGALELAITFVWPHLAGTAAKRRQLEMPKTTRPDLDNSAKQITDCLVKLQFLYDDGQIARLVLSKFHGPAGRVSITLNPLQETL